MAHSPPVTQPIIYLASPYTHPDLAIRTDRFSRVTKAAALLVEQGNIVYGPITMTHPIDVVLGVGVDTLGSDFWVRFDEAFMAFCSKIVVLKIDGWQASRGVTREIKWFQDRGQAVEYLEWSTVVARFP